MDARAPTGRDVRKTITVVFCDVVGSTALGERLDAESVRAVIGRYFEEARAVIERHGGTVEKFVGDAVMAVFGIPIVREDDALRAVRAGRELQESVARLNDELERERGVRIQVRVGIDTGEVVAGDAAAGQRFATGDALNVAARLQAAARPGEVLIGERTHRLVRDAVTVERVGPLSLKGKREAVGAARLLAVPGHSGRRLASAIVGREGELDLLLRAYDEAVRERACRLVTVLGPAGAGKSRLVDELLHRLAGEATIGRGRCLSYGQGITFWPVRSAVSEAAGLNGDESPERARERIRAHLAAAPDAALVAERVAETIGVAEVAAHRGTAWAIRRFLEERACAQPLVVVFDDVHWGERTFLDLVETVAAEARDAPILLLCMARPELLDVRPGWAETLPAALRLELTPLDDDDSARLVANLLGGPALARDVRARVVETAEGNPLFLEEIVSMLLEQGLLVLRDGGLAASAELSRISLPPTVQAVLAARLERLAPEQRALLERGAVEGKVFHRGAVEELSPPGERPTLDERLHELAAQDLVQPGRPGFPDERAFRFRHQLLRDVAYERLAKAERAELHERLAGWLERKAAAHVEAYEEILGYHLEQAFGYRSEFGPVDDRARALAGSAATRLASAGLRAYARGDASGASTLLTRSVELLPRDSDARPRLERRLADALFEAGKPPPRRRRATLRCFWSRPLGHRWEFAESGGWRPMLRCSACGKAIRRPRDWSHLADRPLGAGEDTSGSV